MKAIVIYDSITGNTKRIAEEIAKGLNCKAIHVSSSLKIKNYNLVIIGTPVHAFKPSRKIKNFLEKEKINADYAVFCTYGARLIGMPSAKACLNYIKKRINAKCIGQFLCPGFHSILKMYKERPNETDLKKARKFGRLLRK